MKGTIKRNRQKKRCELFDDDLVDTLPVFGLGGRAVQITLPKKNNRAHTHRVSFSIITCVVLSLQGLFPFSTLDQETEQFTQIRDSRKEVPG
jgi:hypothetical protein